ncbi:glycosyltransferase family 9 protein [Aureispira anguillae]|uniref:Glycosyltransferase family 9 protein n=1 Tax=Aureispira anguillae TaxID=2864201 RepID=A0A916DTG1_9BACT|nr:glycosyltransferase family 9 protein [Aureispira anguillae]BDS12531.1 glycosyltransferase family 9 protein [Aureispira anguillae]
MQKILLLRFSSIGDIVLTSPVVRCLKTQLKEVELHYLTKKAFAPILEANPYIDKVYTFDKTTQPLKKVIQVLKSENYHLIVDLHKNFRSWYVRQKLGIKALVFDKINYQKWLLTQFKINKMPDLHIVDRYLNTVKSLQIQNDNKGLDYTIPTADKVVLHDIDQRLQTNNYIAFVIGAAHATKRLPPAKIKAICSLLKTKLIVLIGGKGDLAAAQIAQEAGAHLINICGQLNLHQSASVVQQAGLVVAHDTGFMHIAAALKRPIVSIWGNTVPDFGMYPYLPPDAPQHHIIEHNALNCRPCSKIGYKRCPKGHFKCMQELDNQTIVNTIQSLTK